MNSEVRPQLDLMKDVVSTLEIGKNMSREKNPESLDKTVDPMDPTAKELILPVFDTAPESEFEMIKRMLAHSITAQKQINKKLDVMQQAINKQADGMKQYATETNKKFDEMQLAINHKVDDVIFLQYSETETYVNQKLAVLAEKVDTVLETMEKVDDIFSKNKVEKYKERVKEEIHRMYSFGVQGKKFTRERFKDGFEMATKELTQRRWSDNVKSTDLTCDTPSIEIDLYFHTSLFGLIGEVTMADLDYKSDLLVTKLYQLERACVFVRLLWF